MKTMDLKNQIFNSQNLLGFLMKWGKKNQNKILSKKKKWM